jgi:hypothetical protein
VGVANREENQLLVFERKVLRTICGTKIENGVCTRRYTTTNSREREREFDSPNALNVTKTSRLRYAGHCAQDRQSWKDLLEQALTKYWL